MLGVQETPIDLATQFLQERQVGDVLSDVEVFGIVDRRFCTQGPTFFEVLLDVCLLIVGV